MAVTVPLEIAGDLLSASNRILTNATLSSDSVILRIPIGGNGTTLRGVTAVVTGVGFADIKNGAPIFTGGGAGQIWTAVNDVGFPQTLQANSGSTSSAITFSLSAYGYPCALGRQDLNYIVSLSGFCLSGNGGGATPVRVDVTNTTDTSLYSTVTATNVAFGPRVCEAEHRRLRQMEAC